MQTANSHRAVSQRRRPLGLHKASRLQMGPRYGWCLATLLLKEGRLSMGILRLAKVAEAHADQTEPLLGPRPTRSVSDRAIFVSSSQEEGGEPENLACGCEWES
jgi:hypothetical protein